MNTATAVRAAHITDTAELLAQIDELRITCQRQRTEIANLRGQNLQADRGCKITRLVVGNAYVPVEYDYEAAQAAVYDVESPLCGPELPEAIEPLRIFINGYWCDLQVVQCALEDDTLIQAISDARGEA